MSVVDSTFIDTNVLVYASDRSEAVKFPKAQALLGQMFATGRPTVSVQMLSEFYWSVTRKIPLPLRHDEAVTEINQFFIVMEVVSLTPQVFREALGIIARQQMSLWDAQLLSAAIAGGTSIILSEDFQHRRTIEGVTFLNPFAADFDPAEILGP